MNINIHLLFPIHLFSNINFLKTKNVIYLIEEPRFFIDFKYHKLKIAYHRATMKSYFNFLKLNNINIIYINFFDVDNNFYLKLTKNNSKISVYDLSDIALFNKLIKIIPNLHIEPTLNFLVNKNLLLSNKDKFFKNNKYNHQNFYKWQRKRLNILIDIDGNPEGGKWSFDMNNREKIPNDLKIPKILDLKLNKESSSLIDEAKEYTNKYFKNNYGSLDNFIYPINHEQSNKWLLYFLKIKFKNFGIYEDAETLRDPFLYHSVLSPMMNIGLLTDQEVLNKTLKYKSKIPLSSFEGFIRQIIGWRNYIYSIYLLEGYKLTENNFLNNNNKLNKKIMWEAKTNLIPIDNIIKKIIDYGYAHHIERLMYLGNYLLLCMINPKYVYEIFMEWTIDAYEWVMIPNVYGMSQFASGEIIMTRPYFCSSNYILKMSDYKKDKWCSILNNLYYNFINTHKKYLASNYATSRQVAFWEKKNEIQKKNILKSAKIYLENIIL
jgi:deoxyribodipyrimidine photolyase-related protein